MVSVHSLYLAIFLPHPQRCHQLQLQPQHQDYYYHRRRRHHQRVKFSVFWRAAACHQAIQKRSIFHHPGPGRICSVFSLFYVFIYLRKLRRRNYTMCAAYSEVSGLTSAISKTRGIACLSFGIVQISRGFQIAFLASFSIFSRI
ncbi:hypothetical protein P153DRAFT_198124 [Dothidotthia symphoricarpi CBS 119687]|uniref:Uncharacterized protein n=1 Tax=Dothidotthia symphoricarpi CBS 119687 TaxID=1392245 RepID=A0A6A6AHW4_9PLEO|nr:uncharacterized protein P153DRAFT_198124 [Dothidotthia symphoricarpi CBS 119687]KAF2131539.1 hypothetical protein P153DRAFT_198124 [Dothidotthia symphoricarpi CBS 119687]